MPLTAAGPALLAAAMVLSSMVAAEANGIVPGRKFATVSPRPPSTNVRRETLNLVMTSSRWVFFGSVQERALRRASRRHQLRRAAIVTADEADGEKIAIRRCLQRTRAGRFSKICSREA